MRVVDRPLDQDPLAAASPRTRAHASRIRRYGRHSAVTAAGGSPPLAVARREQMRDQPQDALAQRLGHSLASLAIPAIAAHPHRSRRRRSVSRTQPSPRRIDVDRISPPAASTVSLPSRAISLDRVDRPHRRQPEPLPLRRSRGSIFARTAARSAPGPMNASHSALAVRTSPASNASSSPVSTRTKACASAS